MRLAADIFKKKYAKELLFLKREGQLVGDWSNVFQHCLTEARIAVVLSDLLKLSPQEKETLVKAALLHDWFKRHEREAVIKYGQSKYDQQAEKSSQQLMQKGYSEDIVTLTVCVGHTSLKEIEQTNDFLRKVMHFIDDITVGDQIVSIDERVDSLESLDRYKELDQQGKAIFNGMTFFQKQRQLGHKIEKEILVKTDMSVGELIDFLRKSIVNTSSE